MRLMTISIAACCLLGATAPARAEVTGPDLGWMAGCWALDGADTQEIWSEDFGGLLFGYSITRKDGALAAFEDLRIETRNNEIYYVASPNGKGTTDFALTLVDGMQAVFENPDHDFPQQITYRRFEDTMTATIATIDGAKSFDIPMHACTS